MSMTKQKLLLAGALAAFVVTASGGHGRVIADDDLGRNSFHSAPNSAPSLAEKATPPTMPEPMVIPDAPIVAGADVGYLPAAWDVQKDGAVNFTVPIKVPDGRAGMQPALSLNYSSSNLGNGPLGIGWSVSGPSVITRCGRNLTVDGAVGSLGRYCLDGKKLMAVAGDYGKPGAEYRTENEPYARISTVGTEYDAPSRFIVEMQSGVIREYERVLVRPRTGTHSTFIFVSDLDPLNGPRPDAVTEYGTGEWVADRWLLRLERDRSGNAIDYVWSDVDPNASEPAIDPVTGGIEILIKEIRYTRKIGSALDGDAAQRRVVFEYERELRPDPEFAWRYGVRHELRHRLVKIWLHGPNPRNTEPLWVYLLDYKLSQHSGRSRLDGVQHCGTARSPTEPGNSLGGCLWKKKFQWYDSAPEPTFTAKPLSGSYPLYIPPQSVIDPMAWVEQILSGNVKSPTLHVLDIDGNGSDDIVLQYQEPGNSYQRKTFIRRGSHAANGQVTALATVSEFDGDTVLNGGVEHRDYFKLEYGRPVDLDADGKSEILAVREVNLTDNVGNPTGSWTLGEDIYSWNNNTNQLVRTGSYPFGVRGYDTTPYRARRFNLLDLNGDRYLDAVVEGDQNDALVNPTGPQSKWWQNKWSVWMNQGGVLTHVADSPVESRCASQVTDSDGDGRAELVQLYDESATWSAANPGAGTAWATPLYDGGDDPVDPADDLFPGYLQYACAGIGRISTNDNGDVSATTPSPNPAPKNGKGAHTAKNKISPVFDYGDFNGDGLEDEFIVGRVGPAWSAVKTYVRWNTGQGYGPFIEIVGFYPSEDDEGWSTRRLIGDYNGDGRDDILSLRKKTTSPASMDLKVALSKGNGTFAWSTLLNPGVFEELETYTTTRGGDFNADGFPDLVRFINPQHLEVLEQVPHYSDRLMAEQDEPTTNWPRTVFEYSTRLSDKPEPQAPCQYPLNCVKRGFPVVRKVISRAHFDNPANVNANLRTLHYSYEDFVVHLRGRGSLGPRKFRIWDPWRPMEIVQEFDNRTFIADQWVPGTSSPVKVTTVVPFAWPQGGGPSSNSDTLPLSSGTARVTRTYTTHVVKALYNYASYDVHPQTWMTKEWEEPVSVDWGIVNSPSNNMSENIFNISEPDVPLRRRSGTLKFDDYGNLTDSESLTEGGTYHIRKSTYDNLTGPWLIGQLRTHTTTQYEADNSPPPVTRNLQFDYDGLGHLSASHVEKGHPDSSIPRTTTYAHDGYGNVTALTAWATDHTGALTSRTTQIEYAPYFEGQADEHLYPSQVWSPFLPLAYRPSTWVAVHPGYGVPIATMDVNGVQSQSRYDDLGRPIFSVSDGAASVNLTYAGRPDPPNQVSVPFTLNGLVIKSTVLGQSAEIETDALGRTLLASDRGFDGAFRSIKYQRDLLGRLVSLSRPYPQGSVPSQFTNFVHDGLDRTLKTIRPDGSYSQHAPEFFKSTVWDAENNKSETVLDIDGRLISSSNYPPLAPPITTKFEYGPLGLDRVIDAKGNKTQTSYDVLGRPVMQSDPNSGVSKVSYTGFGQLLSRTASNGDFTSMAYDALGRLQLKKSPDGQITFKYDTMPHGVGGLAEAISPDNVKSRWSYDAVTGRATGFEQDVDATTYRIGMLYDNVGRLQKMTFPSVDGSFAPGLTQTVAYNAAEYADRIYFTPNGQAQQKLWQVTSRNIEDGLLVGAIGPDGQIPILLERQYETLTGRIDHMTGKKGNEPLLDLDYGYYKHGLVRNRDDAVAKRNERFDYDALLRLTRWTLTYQAKDRVTDYSYDTIGNLMTVATGVYAAGQVPNAQQIVESNTYGNLDGSQPHALTEHKANGVTEKYGYDPRGRQVDGGGRKSIFTDFELPKSIVKDGKEWLMSYDAFGNRVKKFGAGATTIYVAGAYEKRGAPGAAIQHVFHLSGTDGKLAEVVYDSVTKVYTTQYLLQDTLGSNGVILNANGTVKSRFFQEPFGKLINADGSAFSGAIGNNKHLFTGHEEDGELGLINMRGRMYDPMLKRFMSADPFITGGQGLNRYSYVLNSPLNYTDPTGYQASPTCSSLEGDLKACYPGDDGGGNGGLAPGSEDDFCESCDGGPSTGNADGAGFTDYENGCVSGCSSGGNGNGTGTGNGTSKTQKSESAGATVHPRVQIQQRFDDLDEADDDSDELLLRYVVTLPVVGEDGRTYAFRGLCDDSSFMFCWCAGEGVLDCYDVANWHSFMARVKQLPMPSPSPGVSIPTAGLIRSLGGAKPQPAVSVSVPVINNGPGPASPSQIPKVIISEPSVLATGSKGFTYGYGYEKGEAAAQSGLELVLGKFPKNVEFVSRTPGTATVDVPWGWTPTYNAGYVRGFLDSGGKFRFTSETFTGTFGLEVRQLFGIPGQL